MRPATGANLLRSPCQFHSNCCSQESINSLSTELYMLKSEKGKKDKPLIETVQRGNGVVPHPTDQFAQARASQQF